MSVIEVDELAKQPQKFDLQFGENEIELDDELLQLASDVRIAGEARRQGAEIKVVGNIAAQVEAACDRCAQAVTLNVHQDFDAAFLAVDTNAQPESKDLSAADLNADIYAGETLSLKEIAREQLLLAVDVRVLCKEDCKGLCVKCSANLNETPCLCEQSEVDPRWAGLKQIMKDEG